MSEVPVVDKPLPKHWLTMGIGWLRPCCCEGTGSEQENALQGGSASVPVIRCQGKYKQMLRAHLECFVQFWLLHLKMDIAELGIMQNK